MELNFSLNKPADPQGGLAILIKPALFQHIATHKIKKNTTTKTEQTNARLTAISIDINNHKTVIINAYAPSKSQLGKNKWFKQKLDPLVNEIRQNNWEIIIGGDLNATQSELDRWSSQTPSSHNQIEEFNNIINTHELLDCWRKENPKKKDYSYHKISARKFTLRKKNLNQQNTLANIPTHLLNQGRDHGLYPPPTLQQENYQSLPKQKNRDQHQNTESKKLC
jgi:exonuclease III